MIGTLLTPNQLLGGGGLGTGDDPHARESCPIGPGPRAALLPARVQRAGRRRRVPAGGQVHGAERGLRGGDGPHRRADGVDGLRRLLPLPVRAGVGGAGVGRRRVSCVCVPGSTRGFCERHSFNRDPRHTLR